MTGRRVPLWLLACALILGVVAVIAVRTHGFGLVDTAEREAQFTTFTTRVSMPRD